jgi:hypothetical protein
MHLFTLQMPDSICDYSPDDLVGAFLASFRIIASLDSRSVRLNVQMFHVKLHFRVCCMHSILKFHKVFIQLTSGAAELIK